MNRKRFLSGLLLIVCVRSALAIEPTSATVQIELLRATAPQDLHPLLPVYLMVRVRNDSDSQIRVPAPVAAGGNGQPSLWRLDSFSVFVAEGTTSSLRRRFPVGPIHGGWGRRVWPPSMPQPPHTQHDYAMPLGEEPYFYTEKELRRLEGRYPKIPRAELRREANAERVLFWKPGLYRVKVSVPILHLNIRDPLESNELLLEIPQPQGQDAEAYNLLLKSSWPSRFSSPALFGGSFGGYIEQTCVAICQRCPDSAYYPYAKMKLAKGLCALKTTAPVTLPFPAEPVRGLVMLRELAEDPTFPLSDLALLSLWSCAKEMEERGARKMFEGLDLAGPEARKLNEALRTNFDSVATPQMRAARTNKTYALDRLRAMLPADVLAKLHTDEQIPQQVGRIVGRNLYGFGR